MIGGAVGGRDEGHIVGPARPEAKRAGAAGIGPVGPGDDHGDDPRQDEVGLLQDKQSGLEVHWLPPFHRGVVRPAIHIGRGEALGGP